MDEQEIAKLVAFRNRVKEADRRYREKHVEDIKVKRKEFYEANKETIKEKNREYQRAYRQRKKDYVVGKVEV